MLLFNVFFISLVCAYVTISPYDSCWVAWPQAVGELMMGSEVFRWEPRSPTQQCFVGWKMAACWTFIHYKWCTGDLYKRHCQPVTENLYYSIRHLTPPSYQSSTSYLPKSSIAAAASNIWGITTWRWTDQWSMWVRRCSLEEKFCRAHLRRTLVSLLQLCLMSSAVITPTAIFGISRRYQSWPTYCEHNALLGGFFTRRGFWPGAHVNFFSGIMSDGPRTGSDN